MPLPTPQPKIPIVNTTPSADNPITKPSATANNAAQSTTTQTTSAPTSAVPIPASPGSFGSSTYQNIDQATYDAVKGIVDNKALYNNAKYVNQNDTYGTYQTAAEPLYQQLRSAGRGDIADALTGADWESAVNYLNSIGVPVQAPAAQNQAVLDSTASNNVLDTLNGVINTGSGSQINTGQYIADFGSLANTMNNALGAQPNYNTNGIYNDASNFINAGSNSAINTGQFMTEAERLTAMFNQMVNGNANYNQSQAQFGQSIDTMMNRYLDNDAATQGRITDLWATMNQYGADQTGRYDSAADYIKNTNYLDTPAGQAIQSMYAQRGNDAARNAAANASAGGSIDSYAAANANRQDLVFKNAANEAALNQHNSNVNSLLNTLGMLGNDMNNLQQNQIGLIGQEQNYNLGTQGNILESQLANNQINANMSMGNAASAADAIGTLGNLYMTQSNNASADYNSGINGYTNMYGSAVAGDAANYATRANSLVDTLNSLTNVNTTNSNNASQDYMNLLNTLGGVYDTTNNNETNRYLGDVNADLQRYLGDLDYQLGAYDSDNTLRGNMYNSDNTLLGNMYASDNTLLGTQYKADNDLYGSIYGSDNTLQGKILDNATSEANNIRTTNASMSNAATSAGAQIYNTNVVDARTRELAQMDDTRLRDLAAAGDAQAIKEIETRSVAAIVENMYKTGVGEAASSNYNYTFIGNMLLDLISGGVSLNQAREEMLRNPMFAAVPDISRLINAVASDINNGTFTGSN